MCQTLHKHCRYCNTQKPLEEMTRNKSYKDGYATICLSCAKEYQANKRKNKDYVLEQRAKKFNTTYSHLKTLYDSTEVCEICGKKDPRRSLAVDHCHTSGNVRGLLCDNCNRALGFFKDSISSLENAIKYLKERK